jgi:signal transduction histidine kinase
MLVICLYMQIQTTEIIYFLILTTVLFLLAPAFVLIYIKKYNNRKRIDHFEQISIRASFERELLQTQVEVREQTMQTLAADLHDNIGQLLSLTAATLDISEDEQKDELKDRLKTGRALVIKSIKEMRLLSKIMQGTGILKKGLENAISMDVEYIKKTKIFDVIFEASTTLSGKQSPDRELIIFRIFQEVMNNIIKHSKATRVLINLDYTNESMTLELNDNGVGFDYSANSSVEGLGIQNIEKRVVLLSGSVRFEKAAPHGTIVYVKIPIIYE